MRKVLLLALVGLLCAAALAGTASAAARAPLTAGQAKAALKRYNAHRWKRTIDRCARVSSYAIKCNETMAVYAENVETGETWLFERVHLVSHITRLPNGRIVVK